MSLRTCLRCGWVHFSMTRAASNAAVRHFNEYYNTLTTVQQHEYYGGKPSNIGEYEKCFLCGGSYKNFRKTKVGDCPDGVTMQPILRSRVKKGAA